MPRPVAVFCLLFAWLCANNAVLDFLQVAAWGRMFAGYVHIMTVTEAVEQTFNLNRPCKLCMVVRKDRVKERQSMPDDASVSAMRLLMICQHAEPVVSPAPREGWTETPALRQVTRRDPVPHPPPRAGAFAWLG